MCVLLQVRYVPPRGIVELLQESNPRVLLHVAGSFNPPHPGHMSCIATAINGLRQDKGIAVQAVAVALKSDARLREKPYGKESQLHFSFSQRKCLFRKLASLIHGDGGVIADARLFFDDFWGNFQGDSRVIRSEIDRFYGSMGVRVFRAMGEDQAQRLRLSHDDTVISVPRPSGGLSSTVIRTHLLSGTPEALGAVMQKEYIQLLMDLNSAVEHVRIPDHE